MREHTWVEYINCSEKSDWDFPTCEGGLRMCSVCLGVEGTVTKGTLTTECCGRPITEEEARRIYEVGDLDFYDGEWRTK